VNKSELRALLDHELRIYHNSDFIIQDPVCIPHLFSKKQDIEIAGFFAATIAWGNRKSIISSATRLMQLMDMDPHNFILHHTPTDLKKFAGFVHRTFQLDDLLYFIEFLKWHYSSNTSLEMAFVSRSEGIASPLGAEQALSNFYNYFFSLPHLPRTRKHVATPQRNSACKRLNMFLRWMVRQDVAGVDFGLWQSIKPGDLVIPMDVHVSRVAYRLGMVDKPIANWQMALQLTHKLRDLNPEDPVLYDYALFGLGVQGKL
jgi:uncharacterized protein (TIGR02757 family)